MRKTEPPVLKKIAKTLEQHNDVRVDPYYWLKNRKDPSVIAYLKAENDYVKAVMDNDNLQEQLFNEMKARMPGDDVSVAYRYKGYEYFTKLTAELEYYELWRRRASQPSNEQLMLDVNQLAAKHDYFDIGEIALSPDETKLAFTVDTKGDRRYQLYLKDLQTDDVGIINIDNLTGNITWAKQDHIMCVLGEANTQRPFKLVDLQLSTGHQETLFEEVDETYSIEVSKSKSEDYLFCTSYSTLSTEVRYKKIDDKKPEWQVFQKRQPKLEYTVEENGERFVIHTNLNAKNFQIMTAEYGRTEMENWKAFLPHRPDTYIEDVDTFKNFLIASEKINGQSFLRILFYDSNTSHQIEFEEAIYLVEPYINKVFHTDTILFSYQSLTTPETVYSYNVYSRQKKQLKQEYAGDLYQPDEYACERIYAKATDGTQIPISLVYRKDPTNRQPSNRPTLLYGYGAYGYTVEPEFSRARLSLLDRGFIFAIAHVRGGAYLGRAWYEQGKLLNKQNTFTDFIACSEALIDCGYTNQDHLYATGGSAGGLLIGAVVNMRADLYRAVIASVPFVDVVTTMLDPSIPLTTGEYDEWGDPNDQRYYHYMLEYSPYDNVKRTEYPHMLITAGLNDSQVQYWEPAKWVAKLRDYKTDDHLLLLKTNLNAGHIGSSGRFEYLKEIAVEWAFLLKFEAE